ncbi:MAG: hypothetical protein IZT59_00200, partial [Verrucomicrobia bacterium]|nr:hypothetical protein [Verrucomicrobiota bacterium]
MTGYGMWLGFGIFQKSGNAEKTRVQAEADSKDQPARIHHNDLNRMPSERGGRAMEISAGVVAFDFSRLIHRNQKSVSQAEEKRPADEKPCAPALVSRAILHATTIRKSPITIMKTGRAASM